MAWVEDAKVKDYLLNPSNLQNRGKAALFERFGFTRDDWRVLSSALQRHPLINPVMDQSVSPHGMKYVVACNLDTPDGRSPCFKSVWIIDNGQLRPRLVTAYSEANLATPKRALLAKVFASFFKKKRFLAVAVSFPRTQGHRIS